MGNSLACFSPIARTTTTTSTSTSTSKNELLSSTNTKSKSRKAASSASQTTTSSFVLDDSYIKEQARIASMLYLQSNNGADLLLQLDRSVSTKNPPPSSKPYNKLAGPRSRSLSSSTSLSSLHLPKQDVGRSDVNFVLVHGGGYGAWCWYKIIALLKESKFQVTAIDLTGSGANFCDINSITTLPQYAKPLTDFLANLDHGKEVVLVGHDIGGACISYAMELYPAKVSKAVFVAATMLTDGQSALDVFSQQSCLNDLNQRARKFVYADGKNQQPTAMDFDRSLLDGLLFNRTPSKDIALASVSMRAVPFAPVTEKLSLSAAKYGLVSRFYIKTDDDFAIPQPLQEAMIQATPPKQVFEIKGSDHSPFFSKPQTLHRILTEISNLPGTSKATV